VLVGKKRKRNANARFVNRHSWNPDPPRLHETGLDGWTHENGRPTGYQAIQLRLPRSRIDDVVKLTRNQEKNAEQNIDFCKFAE
jgi:hypothetical protein